MAANLSCILTFLLWKPDPEQLYLFFVLPALWGMADAIWQTQANGKGGTTVLPKTNFSILKSHLLFRNEAPAACAPNRLKVKCRVKAFMTKTQNGTKTKQKLLEKTTNQTTKKEQNKDNLSNMRQIVTCSQVRLG